MDCSLTGSSVRGILQLFPSWDLPDPGTEPGSAALQADFFFFFYHLSHQQNTKYSKNYPQNWNLEYKLRIMAKKMEIKKKKEEK